MECRRNHKGEKMCNIVTHPDRNWETFCTECPRRFITKDESWNLDSIWLLIVLLAFLFLVLVLSGCRPNKQSNLLLIRTADIRDEIKSID